MFIKSIQIKNFKSFENITVHLNNDLNIFTGINNSGKTTILEAISLWSECFRKLINQAKRGNTNYNNGDFVFGPTYNKYFEFDDINSVRSPYFEDIFRNRNKKYKILLNATVEHNGESLTIGFKIGDSTGRYIIELDNHAIFNYKKFNTLFNHLKDAISTYYASPVSLIRQTEDFTSDPKIKDAINKRESSSFMRNRLYRLLNSTDITTYSNFEKDLAYILFNTTTAKLTFKSNSNIHRDIRAKINYQIGNRDYEKDIALLGSGSLQIIEILLNIYQQENPTQKDLNLILLDEPDSYIHRDIQKRLVERLLLFAKNNQLFITTHNEALIRSSSLKNLFHIDSQPTGEIKNLYSKDLLRTEIPKFKGMFPDLLNPVIKAIGNNNGLDFINAIEADRIIFVEGEDDARVIFRLLQSIDGNSSRKFMFWVLGGVSKVFSKINTYKTFFSDIKNEKTLWEKSYLVIDKDNMTDNHAQIFSANIMSELSLPNTILRAYTIETILFTDISKLSTLLQKKYHQEDISLEITTIKLSEKIRSEYNRYKVILEDRYSDESVINKVGFPSHKDYKGKYIKHSQTMFNNNLLLFENDDVKFCEELKTYYKQTLSDNELYKLMNKTDAETILNNVLKEFEISFDIESDFYSLIQLIDISTWFEEFNFIREI
ncbi:AAA family ATPase [Flavobacterium psychrophilum]|nr:AAA family ATPase [Flavobacterium psychrophilum]EKT4509869.1 AAA family ATPase [Flavobacterium psychrophilum]